MRRIRGLHSPSHQFTGLTGVISADWLYTRVDKSAIMWVWRVYWITLIWKIEGFKRKRLRSPRRRNPALRPAFRLKLQHQSFLDYQPAGLPHSPHSHVSKFLKRVYLHIHMHMYAHTRTLLALFVWRTLMPLPRNPFSKLLPIHAHMWPGGGLPSRQTLAS